MKPQAIIVDLDGTLAIHQGRSPFEYHKCDTDLVNEPVANIVRKYLNEGWAVIYCSGREDSCRNKTLKWLLDNNLINLSFELFMRKEKDFRKDTVVKEEIYKQKIEPYYDVLFVLDDRNCVVNKWRELGLTCLQVAKGNF